MYAVFFMAETFGLPDAEDQTIHVFESEEAAEAWVFEQLVRAGRIQEIAGGYAVGSDVCDTKAEAVESVRDSFMGLEFLHVYKAVDHRVVTG
jgi:hypothetical protein